MKTVKFLSLILACFLSGALAFAQNEQFSLFHDFNQGNLFYKQGDYKKAIDAYEGVLQKGLESGPLYYNLANSYFKNNQLGKAVANYLKAKRLMPRDSDLYFNYKYALSLVADDSPAASKLWVSWLQQFSQSISRDEFVKLLLAIYVLSGLVYLSGLFLKWPKKYNMLLSAAFGVMLILLAAAFVYKINLEKGMAVILKETEAKFEPRRSATTHFKLAEGTQVSWQEQQGEWVKVKRRDGKLGWVEGQVVEVLAH